MTRTIVQKYGGTSVGSVELIQRVAGKVAAVRERGERIAVVVSAMGDHTDRLVDLAAGISREPNPREMDVLLATGEQVSIALLAMALCERGIDWQTIVVLGERAELHRDRVPHATCGRGMRDDLQVRPLAPCAKGKVDKAQTCRSVHSGLWWLVVSG